jgi:hypothetical protein
MAIGKDQALKNSDDASVKKAWKKMALAYVGEAKDVVQGGTGKLSPTANDSGDVRKPKGQG